MNPVSSSVCNKLPELPRTEYGNFPPKEVRTGPNPPRNQVFSEDPSKGVKAEFSDVLHAFCQQLNFSEVTEDHLLVVAVGVGSPERDLIVVVSLSTLARCRLCR